MDAIHECLDIIGDVARVRPDIAALVADLCIVVQSLRATDAPAMLAKTTGDPIRAQARQNHDKAQGCPLSIVLAERRA